MTQVERSIAALRKVIAQYLSVGAIPIDVAKTLLAELETDTRSEILELGLRSTLDLPKGPTRE